jgi:hypothetical protein
MRTTEFWAGQRVTSGALLWASESHPGPNQEPENDELEDYELDEAIDEDDLDEDEIEDWSEDEEEES